MKVHLRLSEKLNNGKWIHFPACGVGIISKISDIQLSSDIRAVTCKRCKRTVSAATRRIKFLVPNL